MQASVGDALLILKNEIINEPFKGELASINLDSALIFEWISPKMLLLLQSYLEDTEAYYTKANVEAQNKVDRTISLLEKYE